MLIAIVTVFELTITQCFKDFNSQLKLKTKKTINLTI